MLAIPRVYDTFLFDGELDLLEHRLRQNYDLTDFFVLVEAAATYTGTAKPFYFEENRERFAWALPKIRAIQLQSLGPPNFPPRMHAAVQRNSILMALADAAPDDTVLLLDADEIPSVLLLQRLRAASPAEPQRIEMTRHYQRLNQLAPASTCCVDRTQPFAAAANYLKPNSWHPGRTWSGRSGVAVRAEHLSGKGGALPFAWRFTIPLAGVIADGGRHLTAVDASAQLWKKMPRVFHAEWATPRGLNPLHLSRCEEHAVHHRGWWYAEVVPGDLPKDLARLAAAFPYMVRAQATPIFWRRRCVRSWAWLRQWTMFPDAMVARVDATFDSSLILLSPLLLLADFARCLVASLLRKRGKEAGNTGEEH